MKYLDASDVDAFVDQCQQPGPGLVGCTADERALLRDRARARKHATATAAAFTRALKKNGGPFATQAAAMEATRVELEADWGTIARAVRVVLKIVSVLYPQSRLFVIVFDALFVLWTNKNIVSVTR